MNRRFSRLRLLLVAVNFSLLLGARGMAALGGTEKQCAAEYGAPVKTADEEYPVGQKRCEDDVKGRHLTVTFQDDHAIEIRVSAGKPQGKSEQEALLAAQLPGVKWEMDKRHGDGRWRTTDGGALASFDASDGSYDIRVPEAHGDISPKNIPVLGENEKQYAARYGEAVENLDWLAAAPATRARAYSKSGLKILVEFADEKACMFVIGGNDFYLGDLRALLSASAGGAEWEEKKAPGEIETTFYRRTDGKALASGTPDSVPWPTVTIYSTDWAKRSATASNAELIQLGDTPELCAAKCGQPVKHADEKIASLFQGGSGNIYSKWGFQITVYFTHGKALAIHFEKKEQMTFGEWNGLFAVESRGCEWRFTSGEFMVWWHRSDKKVTAMTTDMKSLMFMNDEEVKKSEASKKGKAGK